ncbi:MAG: GntR family transcriptional regulator [Acidobacteria bacterium]|nr:GntR family transcriptional regulator [Acidobacteriota bacterium]
MGAHGTRRNAKRARGIPAEAGSRTALAYRAIKEEILGNVLHAGDAVPMERFVRELRLSRTPVREAILQLSKEGFIDVRPRMGTFVSHLDLRQIQEMYEVRSLIEGHAARLATELIPPQTLAALEDELRAQKTEGEIDAKAISEAGQNVHRLVVNCCGNRVLAQMILSLQDHFTRFRKLSLQIPEKTLSSHREHLEIVAALKCGDGGLAELLVHRHHQHAAQYLLESLLRRSSDADGPRLTVAVGD